MDALKLKEGDDIEVRIAGERIFDIELDRIRLRALEAIRRLRWPLPDTAGRLNVKTRTNDDAGLFRQ